MARAIDNAKLFLGGRIDILTNKPGDLPPSGVAGVDVAHWERRFQAMVRSDLAITSGRPIWPAA